jgi:hypothetical protein
VLRVLSPGLDGFRDNVEPAVGAQHIGKSVMGMKAILIGTEGRYRPGPTAREPCPAVLTSTRYGARGNALLWRVDRHWLDPECWYAWGREPFHYGRFDYYGRTLLWTYQYPFSWWDFRNRRESRGRRINSFENSKTATHAHRAFCMDLAREFPAYSADIWGITSSDGPGVRQRVP